MMTQESARFVSIPGLRNIRDLGGLTCDGGTTRVGSLLRSEAPVDIGSAGRRALREWGLKTVVDLREAKERSLAPVDIVEPATAVHAVPLFGGPAILEEADGLLGLYRDVVERRGRQFRQVVRVVTAAGALPAMIACTAGKDRTGLVVAVILSALGVPDEEVVSDYALSEGALRGAFREAIVARARRAGMVRERALTQDMAPAHAMRQLLAHLRQEYGGAGSYLQQNGTAKSELDDLREVLVDRGGPAR